MTTEVGKLMGDPEHYKLPIGIVNKLLYGIITSIVVIGAYMIVWGYNDAQFKSGLMTRVSKIEDLVALHDTYRKQSDQSVSRLDSFESKIDDLDERQDRMEDWRRSERGK